VTAQPALAEPSQSASAPAPADPVTGERVLTQAQIRAIRTAMHLFVEEDLNFGTAATARRWCVRCLADRPAAGFVAYDCGDFCNACATSYEIDRARGRIRSPQECLPPALSARGRSLVEA
jgi:hypothetical protein